MSSAASPPPTATTCPACGHGGAPELVERDPLCLLFCGGCGVLVGAQRP